MRRISTRLDAIRDGLPGSAASAGSPGRPSLLGRWDARILRAPLLILLVNTVLLLLRTWPRLTKPEVWAEDGVVVIPTSIEGGVSSLLWPLNDYLAVAPRAVNAISLSISFEHYALVSTVIAFLVTLAVLQLVAQAPTHLFGGVLLSAAVILVPSDAEVFGLPLYLLWWLPVLLLVLVFWDATREHVVLRSALIIIAGLSNPLIIAVLPLFFLRAWASRWRRSEVWLFGLAAVIAAIQVFTLMEVGGGGHGLEGGLSLDPQLIVERFLGDYLVGNLWPGWVAIAGVVVLAFVGFALVRHRRSGVMWLLVLLWLVTVVVTGARQPLQLLDPVVGGPRYFFFPYLLLSWFLVQVLAIDPSRWVRAGAALLLAVAVLNTLPVLDRKHDDLAWATHVRSCESFEEYMIPIQFAGSRRYTWAVWLSPEKCRALAEGALLPPSEGGTEFAYRVVDASEGATVSTAAIDPSSTWTGTDYESWAEAQSSLPEHEITGTWDAETGNAAAGTLLVHLERGDRLWYRSDSTGEGQRIRIEGESGPSFTDAIPPGGGWVLLEFSNDGLPDAFDVAFIDEGDGWGEWAAVGLLPE
jgi:hypothetical protein